MNDSSKGRITALIIDTEGNAEVRDIVPDLGTLQGLVGGYLEAVAGHLPSGEEWHAYVNEDGAWKGLSLNPTATLLCTALGWAGGQVLVGPAVFLSSDRGDEATVPPAVIAAASARGLLVTQEQS